MRILKTIVMLTVVVASGMGVAQASGTQAGPTLWERTCIINGEPTVMPPILCKGRGGEVPEQYQNE
ncbi:hypothetical protein LRP50_05055 [Enterovibrio sp. ZSDZ42]|uniref:Secreted protein n=1 Tax=Enterovibrio gelatinilyticus TaxID=2899819 RepID=A0ABT5QX34_9GAMM|nr:hypothetical protein [Enterovibrio sp. ZSDZ42]MDD1792495.1 hypothetical protein [Enterovibrio sp. ZSDZ42]